METKIRAGIVGASGYTGSALAALLAQHPAVTINGFYSHSSAGEDVATRLPLWRDYPPAQFAGVEDAASGEHDVVFFATPHTVAMQTVPACLRADKVVIDLGADFRLQDADDFQRWYNTPHTAARYLPQAVYGFSEFAADALRTANLIACPGCYATAVLAALVPFAATQQLTHPILVDAKSGTSGAGKAANRSDLLLAEMGENFKAYGLGGHRHTAEVLQTLAACSSAPLPAFNFIPHLLPLVRGIHANVYLTLDQPQTAHATLQNHWQASSFIEVLPEGGVVELAQTAHTNRIIISVHSLAAGTTLVSVVLDNLIKGAAGQAVQNMNLRFGLPEATGLAGARRTNA